jgi:murein L,D-transpeptidase YafK
VSISVALFQFSTLLLLVHFASPCVSEAQTIGAPSANTRPDKVVVLKSKRELQLWSKDKLLKTYKIALGSQPIGAKQQQGDHKTPEGSYVLDWRSEKSSFYRAIHISYPNADDRARAKKLGVHPGGAIMLHGLPNGYGKLGKAHLLTDWTDGCIAVTNEELDEIWRAVPNGTPIVIKP